MPVEFRTGTSGSLEVEVPTARGDGFDGGRQCAVLEFELAQLGLGVGAVDINGE